MYRNVRNEENNDPREPNGIRENGFEERPKARAFVIKCKDGDYLDLVDHILRIPDCELIYHRSSRKRLQVLEEDY